MGEVEPQNPGWGAIAPHGPHLFFISRVLQSELALLLLTAQTMVKAPTGSFTHSPST